MQVFGGIILLALFTLLLSASQVRASGFFDSFEGYAQGSLDSTDSAGPNAGPNGGPNPWFGSAPPNLRVVNAENGVTPHSGTNMVRGCYNCQYDSDVDWFNLSYRCATGGVYSGNIALDWWFYDPLGAAGGGTTLITLPSATMRPCSRTWTTTRLQPCQPSTHSA